MTRLLDQRQRGTGDPLGEKTTSSAT